MFRVLNFATLIRYISISTTLISIAAAEFITAYFNIELPWFRVVSIAPWVAVTIIFVVTAKWSSRFFWRVAKRFNKSLYPDLNGTWEGEIITEGGQVLAAKAIIRQALLQTEIDMHTESTKSITLETTPAIEAGQYKLYYTYRAKPKEPKYGSYTGSTIFDVRTISKDKKLELSGYYYTDRKTCGRTRLRQTKDNLDDDGSFY